LAVPRTERITSSSPVFRVLGVRSFAALATSLAVSAEDKYYAFPQLAPASR